MEHGVYTAGIRLTFTKNSLNEFLMITDQHSTEAQLALVILVAVSV